MQLPKKEKLSIQLSVVLIALVIFLFIVITIATTLKSQVYRWCCNQNNATYEFFNCHCSTNDWHCGNVSCGGFCKFGNGSLIDVKKVKCSLNVSAIK